MPAKQNGGTAEDIEFGTGQGRRGAATKRPVLKELLRKFKT
jgi:hypothetical protein